MTSLVYLMLIFMNLVLKFDILLAFSVPDINGILVPVFTPYREDDTSRLDLDKVDDMAKDYADNCVTGVVVAGKAGEGYLLSEDECKALFKAWVKAGRRYGLKVLVVVGDVTPTGIRLAMYAERIGVDAILILLPLFYKPLNAQAALADMQLITDKVRDTPVLLYVDPMTKSDCVRIEELHSLATKHIAHYVGMRCNLETGLQIRAAGLYNSNQILLISNHYSIAAVRSQGFNASVAVASSLVPGLAVATLNADCQEEALEYQEKINRVIVASAHNPRKYVASCKAAYSIISGIAVGRPRSPLMPLTCEDRRHITRNLRRLDIDLKRPELPCDDSDESNED